MRFLPTSFSLLAGALLLGAGVAGAQEETPFQKLERENRQLQLQLKNLRESLTASRIEEEAKTKALKEVKEHLALFGKDFFAGGDNKLLHAVSNNLVTSEKLNQLEASASDLLPILKDYLRTAVASDPGARLAVESKIRSLEAALGLRKQPKRKIEQGTAQEARIVTVDSDTGVVVVNAGHNAELTVGMQFRIERAGQHIGDALVAATRPNVSGLLMQSLINPDVPVQPGDLAKIILNSDPTN
ncbi:hypothetical protein V2O64_20155 [Verrucomicrobiaceae bacterium 227]